MDQATNDMLEAMFRKAVVMLYTLPDDRGEVDISKRRQTRQFELGVLLGIAAALEWIEDNG